jgi:hypothetical protein
LFEARPNSCEYLIGWDRLDLSGVEFSTAALHFIEPCAVSIRIARTVEFLE